MTGVQETQRSKPYSALGMLPQLLNACGVPIRELPFTRFINEFRMLIRRVAIALLEVPIPHRRPNIRFVDSLIYIAIVLSIFISSSPAYANGGRQILYIDCQPGHSLYIKTMVLFDITPVVDKRTFDLANLAAEQRTQECQVAKSAKAIVHINASQDDTRNNNVSVSLNDKLLGDFSFADPDQSYTCIITNLIDEIDINLIKSVESSETKTTRLKK